MKAASAKSSRGMVTTGISRRVASENVPYPGLEIILPQIGIKSTGRY